MTTNLINAKYLSELVVCINNIRNCFVTATEGESFDVDVGGLTNQFRNSLWNDVVAY